MMEGTINLHASAVYRNIDPSEQDAELRSLIPPYFLGGKNVMPLGGSVIYFFPVPPAHWLPNAECRVIRQACSETDYACKGAEEACALTPDPSLNQTAMISSDRCSGILRDACVQEASRSADGMKTCLPRTFMQPCNWSTHSRNRTPGYIACPR